MLLINNVTLTFGTRTLFKNINLKFTEGNCYGLIGANGAGKSTFLKILVGDIQPTKGDIAYTENERISILKQNHNDYNDFSLIETVIMGNDRLYKIMKEKEEIYNKENFSDEDGIRVGELEAEFADMNGWEAESEAAILLSGLGIANNLHTELMGNQLEAIKIKVLLAQALFGNPEILLLDEPTNYLDIDAKIWLEEFLINYSNTVIVVSHDRHFLNKVCTHTLDIDYENIKLYAGNYDFWYESSQLLLKQMKESNKKKEDKIKELQDFIARFSANASKSKQATSRKKSLEKIVLEELQPSNRKYPYINFEFDKKVGREVLQIKNLTKIIDNKVILDNINITVNPDDKIAFIGQNELAKTALFNILAGIDQDYEGTVNYGSSINYGYFPKNHDEYFKENCSIFEWLCSFYPTKDQSDIRAFLGRMLFSGDDALNKVSVLSGGEKVRCMFSKLMLSNSNFLIMDEPTNHLDIESITALNKGLINYKGVILFSSYDYELINTTANRIIEIKENGKIIDKMATYDEYLEYKRGS